MANGILVTLPVVDHGLGQTYAPTLALYGAMPKHCLFPSGVYMSSFSRMDLQSFLSDMLHHERYKGIEVSLPRRGS
jgi:hypothetical protein